MSNWRLRGFRRQQDLSSQEVEVEVEVVVEVEDDDDDDSSLISLSEIV
jgi:hypothetical protein